MSIVLSTSQTVLNLIFIIDYYLINQVDFELSMAGLYKLTFLPTNNIFAHNWWRKDKTTNLLNMIWVI